MGLLFQGREWRVREVLSNLLKVAQPVRGGTRHRRVVCPVPPACLPHLVHVSLLCWPCPVCLAVADCGSLSTPLAVWPMRLSVVDRRTSRPPAALTGLGTCPRGDRPSPRRLCEASPRKRLGMPPDLPGRQYLFHQPFCRCAGASRADSLPGAPPSAQERTTGGREGFRLCTCARRTFPPYLREGVHRGQDRQEQMSG